MLLELSLAAAAGSPQGSPSFVSPRVRRTPAAARGREEAGDARSVRLALRATLTLVNRRHRHARRAGQRRVDQRGGGNDLSIRFAARDRAAPSSKSSRRSISTAASAKRLSGHPSRGRVSLNSAGGPRMLTVTAIPLDGSDGVLLIASDETRLHELEQTRRDFVASVSHELRTPLSSINLMIETILDNDGDTEALDLFLPRVKREVDRMVQLVEDLLDLARAESGRLAPAARERRPRQRGREHRENLRAARGATRHQTRATRDGIAHRRRPGPARSGSRQLHR